ncbi:hypothetical protein [Saccharothrix algeriensis]|uniref:GerMN domain-containing protein n=1 Tax=Saccharothrix algeriensis TaxID=173560 RepID=A0A8T8HYU5_9PSEU|nr:hypothetical protein [Saccharothrix algeriensis]MBM7809226.1 hypothetical protein [Saccharothrix algeriensis]QTR03581.1 hypothetical protein J7S33_00490 [Saccharothrix algeriensis]
MTRRTGAVAVLSAAVLSTVVGCGVGSSGVLDGGRAPTGVAPGVTLYFVDGDGGLTPQFVRSGRLGGVAGALEMLLRIDPPPGAGWRSDLPAVRSLGPAVTVAGAVTTVALPLSRDEVGARGVDQVVCTALGVNRQAGGPGAMEVVVSFTDGSTTGPRGCPVPG